MLSALNSNRQFRLNGNAKRVDNTIFVSLFKEVKGESQANFYVYKAKLNPEDRHVNNATLDSGTRQNLYHFTGVHTKNRTNKVLDWVWKLFQKKLFKVDISSSQLTSR